MIIVITIRRLILLGNFKDCISKSQEFENDSKQSNKYAEVAVILQQVGMTGFCIGGALSIASSVLVPEVDAVVSFYGVPSPELADPAQAKAPIQAHFVELDNIVGFSDVMTAKALEEKLKASGIPYEVHIYPGNAHAFMNMSPESIKEEEGLGNA
ncbi:hypothetical protein CRYUN_Cryun20dG0115300 [Craigia yunnanensis]